MLSLVLVCEAGVEDPGLDVIEGSGLIRFYVGRAAFRGSRPTTTTERTASPCALQPARRRRGHRVLLQNERRLHGNERDRHTDFFNMLWALPFARSPAHRRPVRG